LVAWTSNTKRGTRDQQTRLRGLAGEKGYEAVPALRSDGWHIVDRSGKPVPSADGRTTFTIDQALAFLKRQAPPLAL
jgi:hypothetical protein